MNLSDSSLLRSLLYNGSFAKSHSGKTFAVHNPATGALLAEVSAADAHDARRAIETANSSLPRWRARSAAERAQILRRYADLMLLHVKDLATILTSEQGKPLAESEAEVRYAASFLEWFGEEARRIYGETVPSPFPGSRILVIKEPVGVCVAITPWNFPLAMVTRKLGPALAAGCSMVVKPASATPLSALALAELATRAGVPAGVFHVLPTAAADLEAVSHELLTNPGVNKVTFTGSTETGRKIAAQCAPTLKRLSLELGGNAPFIVFDDADLEAAAEGAMAAKFRNAGQTCVSANRFLVARRILPAFALELSKRVAKLKLGSGIDSGVDIGPLINRAALEKVERHVKDALSGGAKLLTGGHINELGGTFFEPTVLSPLSPNALLLREETFGPILALLPFDNEAEAVQLANGAETGLAAYFYARDLARVWRVAEALEYGMVGVNTGLISTAVAPFGGKKQSGYGREGSRHGIDAYVELKYICLGGLT